MLRRARGPIVNAKLSYRRAWRALIVVCTLALVAAACGSSSKSDSNGTPSGSGSGKTTLNGSGSTFQKTFDEAAIQAFQQANSNITVNYAGGGSGKGKTDLQTKTVDFAGTDSLIKAEDVSKYQGGEVLYFPTVAAPITVSFNVSGLDKVQLSPETIAKIFGGTIKKWNDAAIAQDNPGANLPSTDITIVHRADASGTTSNFTKYLAAAAGSAWTLGTPGDTVTWPTSSQAGQGNAGVAQIIKQTDGAIGYVDYSDAVASSLKFASVKNASGSYVEATLDGAAAAVSATTVKDELTYSPLNQTGADVYPITSPTWIIVYAKQTDKTKAQALKSFLTFVLNDGQGLAKQAMYAPLPDSLKTKAIAQLAKIQIPA
jgi:phosphate transport system substrate-binding protein